MYQIMTKMLLKIYLFVQQYLLVEKFLIFDAKCDDHIHMDRKIKSLKKASTWAQTLKKHKFSKSL